MNISVEMLNSSGIDYDWSTLFVGINMDMVELNELEIYAIKIMNYVYEKRIYTIAKFGTNKRVTYI